MFFCFLGSNFLALTVALATCQLEHEYGMYMR